MQVGLDGMCGFCLLFNNYLLNFKFIEIEKLSPYGDLNLVILLEFYTIMVIWNRAIFLRFSKYGNIAYGNVFRNYYHIWIPKYGKKKTYAATAGLGVS